MTTRVLLADDQALIRAGLRALVGSAPDLEVVGEAADGEEAVRLARELRADVVLMDLRMPGVGGIEATRRIAAAEDLVGVRVLVLTTFEHDDTVVEAVRAGASGFLGKGAEPADLLQAVRVVAAGDALLSPRATRALVERFAALPAAAAAPDALAGLTEREREVLALVAQGLSNEEIAEQLVLSPLTVKTHVNRAMAKTGSRDRAALVVLAYRSGLVRSGVPRAQ